VNVPLEPEVITLLKGFNRPLPETAKDLIVLELYRQGLISSGKAAEVLNMARMAFIQHSSRLGIPFFDMTDDEWQAERDQLRKL
jgi:predicted HTH domain antitoxin